MFGAWLVHPWLLLMGTLLAAAPIVIHLWNRRKFHTVDWAAMDFLVEADQRNRRRVRLEDLLLLLLRCLAMILLGLLVARPFLSARYAAGLFDAASFERIVVLDDSPSMQARARGSTPWTDAKRALAELVEGLVVAGTDDSITLFVTSRPHRPVLNSLPVSEDTIAEILEAIRERKISDRPADFGTVLQEIEKSFDERSAAMNPVVYLLSDMRLRDWVRKQPAAAANAPAANAPATDGKADATGQSDQMHAVLERVAREAAGCFLVDMAVGASQNGSNRQDGRNTGASGNTNDKADTENLVIAQIVPREKVLAAGVASRFEVVVKNSGRRDAGPVSVRFTAGDSLPLRGQIDTIAAGQTASLPFTYTFAQPDDPGEAPSAMEPVPIRAELSLEGGTVVDRLAADNRRYFPARIVTGMPTLIVDGDPSATYGRSERFYLDRALAPPGEFLSGVAVDTVTDAHFETVDLEPYRVIYLLNVYRLSDTRMAALEAWVRSGGGLVIVLGDQIDEAFYNDRLYNRGEGLLPLRLEAIAGDPEHEQWVGFDAGASSHPVLGAFQGDRSPLLEGVKIFQWWRGSIPEASIRAGKAFCPARFTDADRSPAFIERSFGDGRVFTLTTAADADWNNWPENPSYLITFQEVNRYVARSDDTAGSVLVGQPLRHPFDPAKYQTGVSIAGPGLDPTPIQPGPGFGSNLGSEAGRVPRWLAGYDDTSRRGFYRMALTRNDGRKETVLFAANLDATEGNLERVGQSELGQSLDDAGIERVGGFRLAGLAARGAKGELWTRVLWALLIVLCVEQFLGWFFGLRR